MEKKFKKGMRVVWTSQSAGSRATKIGTIVQVVPVGCRPDIKDAGDSRDHVSYVVDVDTVKKHGKTIEHRTPKFYWPRVSMLQAF